MTLNAALNGVSKTATLALTTSVFSVRVHPGDNSYTDPQGFTWSSDAAAHTGGSLWSTTNAIAQTNADALYQTARYGTFSYQFTVPNGSYTVNLKFAEITKNSIGQRVFSVAVNGNVVLNSFDVIAAAGGPFVPVDEQFPVTVTNGAIQIGFIQQVDNPIVSAVEIVQQGTPLSQTALPIPTTFVSQYINAGGAAYVDPQKIKWAADNQFTGGSNWSTQHAITNTTTPVLYQTCRYGEFYYLIPIPNGNYRVILKFAEISHTGAGQRVFNAQINGHPVLTNFDIIAAVGAPFVAVDKTFSATVTNGILVVGFTPGTVDTALVSAVEVIPVT